MTITTKNIFKAIQKGTVTANKKYERWSHGWWLDDAGVESVMVVGIAEALNEVQQMFCEQYQKGIALFGSDVDGLIETDGVVDEEGHQHFSCQSASPCSGELETNTT